MSTPSGCDFAVVGGGIVGLAVARELLARNPGAEVVVLEREPELGLHQTRHNSGVVHAGVYYAPGSLKARLCVEGARALYAYCDERGLKAERCGKLIIARDATELRALDELERRARANEVPGLERVDAAGIREHEPHARGVAGLWSPATGIVDFAAVARAYADDVRAAGGRIVTGCAVKALRPAGGSTAVDVSAGSASAASAAVASAGSATRMSIEHCGGVLEADRAVACAGLGADRLAIASGAPASPRIVPFRGAYMRLRPERRELVRGLIYPVPDPRLPFLGVHLTRTTGGDVLAGPTALLDPRHLRRSLAWPGTRRALRRFWRTGLHEMRLAASRRAFAAAVRVYVPEIEPADLVPAFAGVRAQAIDSDGSLVDDFVVHRTGRAVHVRNAPSPAATSSLALARLIADEVTAEA